MAQITIPGPRVAPEAQPTPYNSDADKAYDAGPGLEQATERIGRIGEQAGQKIQAYQEREKRKADAVQVNDALTSLQRHGTDTLYGNPQPSPDETADAAFNGTDATRGYLANRGKDAAAAAADTFTSLQDKQDQILNGLKNPEQKALFHSESDKLLTQWHGQIEGHSFQELQAAKIVSVANAKAETLRSAALNPLDDKAAAAGISRVVGAEDAIITSPEDALVRADQARAEVTMARLDVLLAKEGGTGFADARRIFEANKAVLGTKIDEYQKRIDGQSVNAIAVATAGSILDTVQPNDSERRLFRGPDEARYDAELAKLAETNPALYAKVKPIADARLAIQKQENKQAKDQFITGAHARFNLNRWGFLSSEMGDRLNKVDPTLYGGMVSDNFHMMRAIGDNSAQARRDQAERNRVALDAYKSADPDPTVRANINVDSFLAGRGVNDVGKGDIKALQSADKNRSDKGQGVGETQFVNETKAKLKGFAPDAGTTPQTRAAAAAWWTQVQAEATTEYADFIENPANKGRKPNAHEQMDMRARVIVKHPPNPKNPASIKAAGDALLEQATPGTTMSVRYKEVDVVRLYELSDGTSTTQ